MNGGAAQSILMPPEQLERATARARKRWRDARAFQRDVQRALVREQVPFAMWLILESLKELASNLGEAVSQNAIAERSGLTPQVVSYWLRVMSEDALLDREPDGDGRAWCVCLTDLGERTLSSCNERLAAAGLTG